VNDSGDAWSYTPNGSVQSLGSGFDSSWPPILVGWQPGEAVLLAEYQNNLVARPYTSYG
jgi:hypothetical protein